ncbi:MAG TPA: cache domain-containing protein [Methylomirabilota bacterium]|jgi:signal transduction histidine kinase|nr:cache domain-containing protein [Methylomirabilota bacterium]
MRALSTFHLRTRLFLLVVLAVLPALGVILFNDLEQRRFAAHQAQEDALQLAQLAAAEQAQLIQGAHQLLSALAQLPAVREGDAKSCAELFAKLLNQYPVYVNLGASRADGAVFCSASPLTQPVNVSSFTWFQRVMQTWDFSIGDYQKSAISDEFVLVVGFPIFDKQEQIAGAVAASLDLRWLSQLAVQARLPQEATLTAVDRNGVVVARYPDPQQWVGRVLQEAPLINAMLAQEEGTTEIQGGDGVSRLYAFTQVREAGDVGLRVSVGIPMAVAFAHVHRLLVRNLTTLGIVTLLMLGVAWAGSDLWVLRPVYALLRVTQQLRAGDLHARTGLPQGFGELDQLVVAFDDMAEALEHREIDQRRAQEAMQQLSRRLLETQENERRAIARELHDEFGQALQALKINLQTAQRFPTDGAQRVADSIEIVDRTLQQVRNLSLDLRPSLLDDLGLVAALEWYIERQTQRTGIAVHFAAEPPELRLEPTLETVCFRVAQEALTNVARHAHARNAWVELRQRDADVHLVIRDDGVGFDSQAARAKAAGGASFGVLGMQERVELAGGQFDITSTPGQGTEIRARFPLSSLRGVAGVAAPGTAYSPALSAREP